MASFNMLDFFASPPLENQAAEVEKQNRDLLERLALNGSRRKNGLPPLNDEQAVVDLPTRPEIIPMRVDLTTDNAAGPEKLKLLTKG